MAITIKGLKDWIKSCRKNCGGMQDSDLVAIDEDGLCLVSTGPQGEELYLEIGGIPEDE
jgi:hypothetical protein